jgi:pentatricopeptide repeat protein
MKDIQVPDAAYSYLVIGWIREKDTEMALQAIRKMWSRNILPETSLVNKLIALFVDLNQMDEAVQVLSELESAGADEGPEPTKHTYLLVLSGLVTLGDGDRVKEMVVRMMDRLQEHPSTMLMNFIVESWCISGRMKKAKKFATTFQQKSMCSVQVTVVDDHGNRSVQTCRCCPRADEHTHAILAAGWANIGNAEVAAEALLSMAEMNLDSSKIDMNQFAQYWKTGKRRQVRRLAALCSEPELNDLQTQTVRRSFCGAAILTRVPGAGQGL